MKIEEYLNKKKEQLIEENKKVLEEKLRIEGAWLVLGEIEQALQDVEKAKDEKETKQTKKGGK